MSLCQPEIEAPDRPEANALANRRKGLGWVFFAGLSLSLVVPEGFSFAPVILMIFGAWSLFKAPRMRLGTASPVLMLVICFAVYAAGSAAISAVHGDPIGHFEQFLPFVGAILIAAALQANAVSSNQFIGGLAVAAILGASASIVQVLRADETHRAYLFTNVTTFGALGALYAVVCASALGWATNQDGQRWRVLLAAGSFGGLTIALLSGTKGSWLPLLFVGPVAFAQATIGLGAGGRIKWGLAVLVYGVLICSLPHSPTVARAGQFTQQGDSFRQVYWKEGLRMIKLNPLLGLGRSEVSRPLEELTPWPDGSPSKRVMRHLHNEYLDVLAAKGALGLLLTLSTLVVPVVLLARSAAAPEDSFRGPAITGILFIVSFAICGLTDVQFQISARRMTYVLGSLMFVHFATRKPPQDQ